MHENDNWTSAFENRKLFDPPSVFPCEHFSSQGHFIEVLAFNKNFQAIEINACMCCIAGRSL